MDKIIQPPRRVETDIEMRCAHCKAVLYIEKFVDENRKGVLVETQHTAEGQAMRPVCSCRKEK